MATPTRSTLRGSLVAPGVRWDERKGRYVGRDGRILSGETVREVIEREVSRREALMVSDAAAYRAGKIGPLDWQRRFETNIRRAHQGAATIARGGFAQLSRTDKDWIRGEVRRQFAYLEGFLRDVGGTDPTKLDGRFDARVRLYAEASRGSHREMERRLGRLAGHTEEKRFLGRADHCQSAQGLAGCVELARRGWRRIGTLPRISETPCRVKCHCWFKTR